MSQHKVEDAPHGVPPRLQDLRDKLAERMSHVGHKLLVLSGKGGVGKSTVAVNLAASLARRKHRVGLLDVDLHGPSVPKLLDLEGRQLGGSDAGIEPVRFSEHLSVMSIGFLLNDPGDAVIWRGPKKFTAILQFLADVDWGDLDFLVIDLPPGTGDEPLAICELTQEKIPRPRGQRPNRGAVIVTTPQTVALGDVRRSIAFCRQVGMPVHGVIENMSGLICPFCGREIDVFLRGGGEAMASELGFPFLGRIPLEPAIVESGERGTPLVLEALRSDAEEGERRSVEAFDAVTGRILAGCSRDPPS